MKIKQLSVDPNFVRNDEKEHRNAIGAIYIAYRLLMINYYIYFPM